MTKLVLDGPYVIKPILEDAFGPTQTRSGTATEYTITAMEFDTVVSITFKGSGFTYDELGFPITGTATSCVVGGRRFIADVTDFKASAKDLAAMRDVGDLYKIFGDTEYVGTNDDSNIASAGGDDTLKGFDGVDTLDGGRGNDSILAGVGNDIILSSAGKDVVNGGAGVDVYAAVGKGAKIDLAETGFQTFAGKNAVKLISIENLIGTAKNDQLAGDDKTNRFDGGAGDDTLAGGGGNDVLEGGVGSDILRGDAGFDTASYAGVLDPDGVTVSLAIKGEQNTDGAGIDRLEGVEALVGSNFGDELTGDKAANQLSGGGGDDELSGGGAADRLNGGDGADQLSGGGGDDRLNGGAGVDRLSGGGGRDTYAFVSASEAHNDVIVSFGSTDVIDLSAIDAIAATGSDDPFSYGGEKLSFSGAAGDLFWYRVDGPDSDSPIIILGDANGDRAADFKIILQQSADLTAADFIL